MFEGIIVMNHVMNLIRASVDGQLSAAKSFWIVFVLYSWLMAILLSMLAYIFRLPAEPLLDSILMPYGIMALFGCFRCSKNIRMSFIRFIVRIFYIMLAFGFAHELYQLSNIFFSRP